jgi:L-lactate dehydrogenase complex protein LldG
MEVLHGPSDGHDLAAVSHAFTAVAETGTLVLTSGPDNPTTLNFLPDVHIVVVDAGDVAADFETVVERLRARYGTGIMPRTVNMITGPSRSADIEQTAARRPRSTQAACDRGGRRVNGGRMAATAEPARRAFLARGRSLRRIDATSPR